MIQDYSPVVILELLFGGFLQPAMWWLCIDANGSHMVKWTVLAIGLFVSFALPQLCELFAEDLDGGKILPGGWALGPTSFGTFVLVFLGGWMATKFRKEQEAPASSTTEPNWFYLPPIDYLLEIFDYNVNEERVFGRENHTWPLRERASEIAMEKIGAILDKIGFAKGNFDGGLRSVIDDFRLTEETLGEEEKVKKVTEESKPSEKVHPVKYGRELPYTYANLVKNISLIFTFGLASPLAAWIGCIGILFRWLALSFLAERYNKITEGKNNVKTDAQGIPFRCIVLVVFCNVGFFATAALLAGFHLDFDDGLLIGVFLVVMVVALVLQILVLSGGGGCLREIRTNVGGRVANPLQDAL